MKSLFIIATISLSCCTTLAHAKTTKVSELSVDQQMAKSKQVRFITSCNTVHYATYDELPSNEALEATLQSYNSKDCGELAESIEIE